MSQNGKIGFLFLVSGVLLLFGAILLCALEEVSISALLGGLSALLCLAGLAFAFKSWDDPFDEGKQE